MRCHDHETIDRARSHSACGQGSYDISSRGVDADPRTRFMIDFSFNNLAALAVRVNNG
jgi:hypothetical protein